ncbi:hypothetical protein BCR43DRAFT_494853 [Syncephalastrum racemosum]|uniref:Uncharacterized protein n=1 Tax=Syncephalastrum racemosum TaxID=13706 RepID=A0A1X2H8R9_SYNRA|nr:hypothetical protein BCR43DRAFT_494853 [Syncephalastrum racemosum]
MDLDQASAWVFQLLGQCYTFVFDQLRQANITMPAPERVYTVLTHIWEQLNLQKQNNWVPILVGLIAAYVVFVLLAALVRSVVRLVYGFVRFTFILAVCTALFLVVQQYYDLSSVMPWLQSKAQDTFVVQQQHQ